MSNISVGNTRINIRIAEPTTNNNVNSEIKLKGIVWSDKVDRTQQPIQDQNNITKRDNGSIPSGNELPELFSTNNNQNDLPEIQSNQPYSNYGEPETSTQTQTSSGGSEMATGIGMAIGGVGGAILGGKYGFKKLGIAIGVAVGGFIGNKLGK
jgi:hypothetical protein